MPKKVKFVQIATITWDGDFQLHAVDENGQIWNQYRGKWTKIESPNEEEVCQK